jgi:fibronectin-binding autotransporter adhesin
MKNTKIARLASALVLTLSSLLTLGVPLVHAAGPYTCVWTGATDLKFSTATNWTGCNSVAPQPGDIIQLQLRGTGTSTYALTNDLGVALGGIIMGSVSDTAGYSNTTYYTINTLHLAAGASETTAKASDSVQHANVSVSALTLDGGLTITGGRGLYSADQNSNIVVALPGNLTLVDAFVNAQSQGTILIYSPTGIVTVDKDSYYGYTDTANSTVVANSGTLAVTTNVTKPLSLGGGSGTTNPTFSVYNNPTISGAVTLTHDVDIDIPDNQTITFTGSITGAGFKIVKTSTSTGTLVVNASSNDSATPNGTQVSEHTTTTLSDDQPTTPLTVSSIQTVILDGTRSSVYVGTGGILEGTGTVKTQLTVYGTIAPGHSPGCMTVGTGTAGDVFTIGNTGTYKVDVGGTTPCTGYDQVKVLGAVDVTGGTLVASLYNSYVPKVGEAYTIIDNDAADAVAGTFVGIAEGGTYTNEGITYSVTYKGGDGNDVVLTVTKVDASKLPAKPNTGLLLVAAHPMISLGASVIAAGLLYGASRRVKTVRR